MTVSNKRLLPGYLVVGEDQVKSEEVMSRLIRRLETSGMLDFNLDQRIVGDVENISDLLCSLNTFPVGADFRLVILKDCPAVPRKDFSEMLIEYLKKPCETTVCLLVAKKLAKNTRLYKAFDKLGNQSIISCEKRKSWDMPNWVRDRAVFYGRTINEAAAAELVGRVGDSTSMLDNELKRVIELTNKDPITQQDIEHWVNHTAEVKPWDIADAVAQRNLSKAYELLKYSKPGSEIVIHKMIVDRLRKLIYVKACLNRNCPNQIPILLEERRSFIINKFKNWSSKFTMDELEEALKGAIDVELAIKGSESEDVALRLWISNICTHK